MCKLKVPFSLQLHKKAAVMSLTQWNEDGGGSDAAQGVGGEFCWIQPLNHQCQRGGCDRTHITLGWQKHTTQLHSGIAGPKLSPQFIHLRGLSREMVVLCSSLGHEEDTGGDLGLECVPNTHHMSNHLHLCIWSEMGYSSPQKADCSSWIYCSLCLFLKLQNYNHI